MRLNISRISWNASVVYGHVAPICRDRGELQSLMGTNGHAGCEQSADDVTCLCKATLTAGTHGGGRYTGNLQIPLENLALRFAARVKSSLMYAQMLPLYLQYAPTCPADYHSFVLRTAGSYPSYGFTILYMHISSRLLALIVHPSQRTCRAYGN